MNKEKKPMDPEKEMLYLRAAMGTLIPLGAAYLVTTPGFLYNVVHLNFTVHNTLLISLAGAGGAVTAWFSKPWKTWPASIKSVGQDLMKMLRREKMENFWKEY